MEWCLDANVVVKVVIEEILSQEARALVSNAFASKVGLIAPHFFDAEVFGALRKKVYGGEITKESAELAFGKLHTLPVQLVPTSRLLDRAWDIGRQCNLRWLYDAFYVALAEEKSCTLWTADMELYRAVGSRFPFVKPLEDYVPPTEEI